MSIIPIVPPIADADRYQSYTITVATSAVDLTFPLFGDASDIEIRIDGAVKATGWTVVSKSGVALAAIALPITDAQVQFSPALTTGHLEITGSWRPRALTMSAAAGISRRDVNLLQAMLIAGQRELYRLCRSIQGIADSLNTPIQTALNAVTAAQAAQAAAEQAYANTLTAYDNFDDRYLGPKAADPALDNDGNALLAGALYYSTTLPGMKVYTGAAWVAAYISGGDVLLKSTNLSDLADKAASRTNLGLADAATKTEAFLRTLPFTAQKTAAYVAVASDAGSTIPITTGGVTINPGVFTPNQILSIYNESDATQVLTQGVSMTLRKMGVANITGNLNIPARGYVTVHFRGASEALVVGVS